MTKQSWTPLDYMVGVRHFFCDRVPGGLPVVPPKPRHPNPFRRNGLPVVSKVKADSDVKKSNIRCLARLGDLNAVIKSGDKVFVKPNFNSPDPFPACTDLDFLSAALELLLDAGAKITLGDCAGLAWRPTRKVFDRIGLPAFCKRYGLEPLPFDERPRDWVRVQVDGEYLKTLVAPRSAYEADKYVYLPCMRTHTLSRFSIALKLSMGFMHPGQRRFMHRGHLEQKVAEINLAWQPDLIIVDGRKSFIQGGPNNGKLAEPGIMLASGDPVATDIEGAKTLLGYKARNRLLPDPLTSPQIVAAVKHKLGEARYEVVGG